MLVLIINHLNYLKGNIFQYFFKKYNRLFFLINFLITLLMENPWSEEEKLITGIKDLFE